MKHHGFGMLAALAILAPSAGLASDYPERTPAIFEGVSGYVHNPSAAARIDPSKSYKALFIASAQNADSSAMDATIAKLAANYSALRTGGVPASNIRFAIIMFGPGADALLGAGEYRKKYGKDNPNEKLLRELMADGVEVMVCGQYMAARNMPVSNLISGVELAEGATIVAIRYGNDGYAILRD